MHPSLIININIFNVLLVNIAAWRYFDKKLSILSITQGITVTIGRLNG
jgi:hypothetical protein